MASRLVAKFGHSDCVGPAEDVQMPAAGEDESDDD
jgi:hypothetical protein